MLPANRTTPAAALPPLLPLSLTTWLNTPIHPDVGEQPPAAAIAPSVLADARARLVASLAPAGAKHVAACLAKIAVATKARDGEGTDWKMRVAVYVEALEGHPTDVWNTVTSTAIETLVWWPSVAELASLLSAATGKRRADLRRIEWLLERKRSEPEPDPRPPLNERLAQIERWRQRFGRMDDGSAAEPVAAPLKPLHVARNPAKEIGPRANSDAPFPPKRAVEEIITDATPEPPAWLDDAPVGELEPA